MKRGDSVVVEGTAATFFQGRVLDAAGETLRVQTATGDPVSIARADAYRLPPPPHVPRAGDLAICPAGEERWVACQITNADSERVNAVDVEGHVLELSKRPILRPTALTKLNIARHFERARRRAAFVLAAARAGKPRPPTSWSPEPGERVVAEHSLGWFYARFSEAADGGARLQIESDRAGSISDDATLVPVPPYDHVFKPGQFALMEPKSVTEPWKPVRIEKAVPDRVTVVDEEGTYADLPARKLIPFSP